MTLREVINAIRALERLNGDPAPWPERRLGNVYQKIGGRPMHVCVACLHPARNHFYARGRLARVGLHAVRVLREWEGRECGKMVAELGYLTDWCNCPHFVRVWAVRLGLRPQPPSEWYLRGLA